MNVLLDGCVPRPLRQYLKNHHIHTAQEMGWGQMKNGDLIRTAEAQFDTLITSDKNLKYQQNLTGRKIAILVLPTNDWPTLRAMTGKIASVLDTLAPGGYVEISGG